MYSTKIGFSLGASPTSRYFIRLLGVTLLLCEALFSRNLGHLFISPLRMAAPTRASQREGAAAYPER